MYGIEIEDGKKLKCPNCNNVFAIKNDEEILYRNITLIYFNTIEKRAEAKCKNCKNMIQINLDGGRIIVSE